jgi:hypothetical protein
MNTHRRWIVFAGALALSFITLNGCAMMHVDQGQLRVGDALNIYAPFDNSRDWGPSYLVGAPGHHLGMGTRIDDNRTDPQIISGRIDDLKAPVGPSPGATSLRIIPDDRPTDEVLEQTSLMDPLSDEAFGLHSDGCQHMTDERVPLKLQCVDPH